MREIRKPFNHLVDPMLNDLYQFTMAYAYWRARRHNVPAAFELFFRKPPFGGEFAIAAGLEEVLCTLHHFHFEPEQVACVRDAMPHADPAFFDWLGGVTARNLKVYAIPEATLAFPRVPLYRVEGPLAEAQLLETTLLNLTNFPTLLTTNAARMRLAAGPNVNLFEFGLRRAQGADGAFSAARYAYIGGFNGTSNMKAAHLLGIPAKGTHAHSFVSSFRDWDDLPTPMLQDTNGITHDFAAMVRNALDEMGFHGTNTGELVAFTAYAQAYPMSFLALVDTYDTLRSGVPNFMAVALALSRLGYRPVGVRIDSGDLAYLSRETRKMFIQAPCDMSHWIIIGSNDLNEQVILELNRQEHTFDGFGIGTNLVTCEAQPALGGVYKLVRIGDRPCIKLSEDPVKTTLPDVKQAFRIWGEAGYPLLDLLTTLDEIPEVGKPMLARHPFEEMKRVHVIPTRVEPLHQLVWDGRVCVPFPTITELHQRTLTQLAGFRSDHLRPMNPTRYKVSVSDRLYRYLHELWSQEAPIPELR